ncbi:MAG TPA: hypothetical protein VL418_15405 [Devosiaceae bacterium]|nr:hypothetical protein [Devosiaceae bacterium]
MYKLVNLIGAVAVAGAATLGAAAPAAADDGNHYNRDHPYAAYEQGYPRGYGHGRGYYHGPRAYGGYGYGYGYDPGYYGYDPGAAVAAGVIGSVFGALAATALSRSGHYYYRHR